MSRLHRMQTLFSVLIVLGILRQPDAFGQFQTSPQPGDIYKEFTRVMANNDKEWRVTDPAALNSGAQKYKPNPVMSMVISDTVGAIRAEIIIELGQGHIGTTGKKFRFNNNAWVTIPEIGLGNGIPAGKTGQCYYSQYNPTFAIPLNHLKQGTNTFEGTSGSQSCYSFGWAQWWWYGAVVRVYYNSSKAHATGAIISPSATDTLSDNPVIEASASGASGISTVEFFGSFNGYDPDGDGVFDGYQSAYHRLKDETQMTSKSNIGAASSAPYRVTWNTDLVPDQPAGTIKVLARIRDNNGVWFVTNEVTGLTLKRTTTSVKLYKVTNVPERFNVRSGGTTKSANFTIPVGDSLQRAISATMILSTWNGLDGHAEAGQTHYAKLNTYTIPNNQFGKDHYYSQDHIVLPTSSLKTGTNTITFNSLSTHHGIDITWPGPVYVVKYSTVPPTLPVFTLQPVSQDLLEGGTATFTATATGSDPLAYQWQKNGVNISGANSTTYTTPALLAAETGSLYRCVASNTAGSATSNAASVTIQFIPPTIVQEPASQTVQTGKSANFNVTATGSAPLLYQWRKNGVNIAGATNAWYITPVTTNGDNGTTYSCIVTNNGGVDTSASATLSVSAGVPASMIQSDDFNATSLNTNRWVFVNPGVPSTLLLNGAGTQDARLSISIPAGSAHDMWTTGAFSPRIMQPANNTDFEVEMKFESLLNAQYQIQGLVVEQDDRNYIRFDFDRRTSETRVFAATVANNTPTTKYNSTITTSNLLYMKVKRVGNSWTHYYSYNGTTWLTTGTFTFSNTLVVGRVGVFFGNSGSPVPAFTGLLDYLFNNSSRISPEDGTTIPPSIITQPVSQTVSLGTPVTLSVVAAGSATLTYQWQKNDVNIPGATSASYSIPLVTLADSGLYKCVVTNGLGNATSNAAVLIVGPHPSGIKSDDFNSFGLNRTRWNVVDPLNDGFLAMTATNTPDAAAAMSLPAGVSHDAWASGNASVRLMQVSNNTDFALEAKFTGQFTGPFQIQGILVQEDIDDYLRFDFTRGLSGVSVFAANIAAGVPSTKVNVSIGTPVGNQTYYVRVGRQGNTWTQWYSLDSLSWILAGSFNRTLNVGLVGPFFGNSGAPAPAFTGKVDYFLLTSDPLPNEDGGTALDTFGPVIANVQMLPGATGFTVTWITDEPTTGLVEYGLTNAYELGATGHQDLRTSHAVQVTGVQPQSTFNLRVSSGDEAGNSTTTSNLVVQTVAPTPPVFDMWYGNEQTFGQVGNPTPYINILGNVTDSHGMLSLSYTLNGGAPSPLSIGPDTRRLQRKGDFNADILVTSLQAGPNEVIITAVDSQFTAAAETVTVNYIAGNIWPKNYIVDWDSVTNIQNAAQVVDGHWEIQNGEAKIIEPGYDRLLAIGQPDWADYEVTCKFTVEALDSGGFVWPSNGSAIGFVFRWPGHSDNPSLTAGGWQPKSGYLPLGAFGSHNWRLDGTQQLDILGDNLRIVSGDLSGKTITYGTSYKFKMRVTTTPGVGGYYQIKTWADGATEPAAWDCSGQEILSGPQVGCLLVVAHQVRARVGDINIVPLDRISTLVSDDFNADSLNPALWSFRNPRSDATQQLVGAGTADARLQLSVPGGAKHEPVLQNTSVRVMQPTNDANFEVQTKFESSFSGDTQMHGIQVEQDSTSYLRFDFSSSGPNTRIFVGTIRAGQFTARYNTVIPSVAPGYMRMKRLGAFWEFYHSYDGVAWTLDTSFTHAMIASAVGPFAGNTGTTPPAYTAVIDYFFNNIAPIVPEDGGGIPPARVVSEPAPLTVVQGDTATFVILASGTPPLTYRWQRNGVDIVGANTATYKLPNVTVAVDNGKTFRCIISNAGGADTSLAAALTVLYPPSVVISDDFSGASLNSTVWTFINPRNDASSVTVQGGGTANARLIMTVPANTSHDIWTGQNHAPRILQDANNTDFELEAKFESAIASSYQFQGIIVQESNAKLLRFDFTAGSPTQNNTKAFAASMLNGVATQLISVNATTKNVQPMWLRVKRQANLWTMSYSLNGSSWTAAGSFTYAMSVDSVGVFMGNAGSPTPAFTSYVDYFFNTAAPIVPEDPLAPSIITNPLSQTITDGRRAAFTVVANGSAPLVYQWQKNGVNIPGATGATYTSQPMSLGENGSTFRCMVSNAIGTATSNNAIVTVNEAVPLPWWSTNWNYRLPIQVGSNGYERQQKPVETPINFSIALATLGGTNSLLDTNSIRIVEVDSTHAVLDTLVDMQFDRATGFDLATNASGTLIFLMEGVTPANGIRYFDVYFDTVGGGSFTLPVAATQVAVTDTNTYEGQASWKIITSGGIYYYHKQGAGFASFIDAAGNDWLAYHSTPGSGASGEFRGIPNASDAFHPGYANGVSTLEIQGPLHTRIRSKTTNNAWELYWDIFPHYARMTMVRTSATYWWLYEGTPGGGVDVATDFTVRPSGVRLPMSSNWSGDMPGEEWAYFGDAGMQRVLYAAHHEDDAANDYFRTQGGDAGMTVFGFGRKDPCCVRYLQVVPQTFTFGFAEDSAFAVTRKTINSAYKDIVVTLSEPEYEGSTGIPQLSNIVSDNFNAPSLNYDLWTYYNPRGDAALTMTGSTMAINIPSGIDHDAWIGANNAPRVMQPANNSNFEVEAKFLSQMQLRNQIEGILVEQDTDNYLRFDFVRNASTTNVFAAAIINAIPTILINQVVAFTSPAWVKVKRNGNQWTYNYSFDGTNWIVAGTFSHTLAVSAVGPFFGNAGASPQFTGIVDYFFNTDVPVTPTKAHGGVQAEEATDPVPSVFFLNTNYPNPFNPQTTIEYGLPEPSQVTLKIYNMLGQEVATLVNDQQHGGYFRTVWNGQNSHGSVVGSGVYIYRIIATSASGNVFTNTRKMILTH